MPEGGVGPLNVAVFDLETNGGPGSSVLSASSIVFDEGGRLLDIFNRFYLPAEPFNRWLFRIHGLTPERLLALRERIPSSPWFIEDWPELMDFWDRWNVEGLVIHNAQFDLSFLPEMAQAILPCWCSMKGLTELCALPGKGSRGGRHFKWPKLGEAVEVLCDGLGALEPPEGAALVEQSLTQYPPHVSLGDCFGLYRVMSRILARHPELVRFKPFYIPFKLPRRPSAQFRAQAREDSFTAEALAFDRKLRDLAVSPMRDGKG